ncbi:MAG: nucleic acid binding OB-fold tRNA/helicase-type [Nitrospirae bacterium]|nr:MAG: nucleic acid binding OB-fold tRNA/helicase-type [Nitrospirota bacterium]
MKRIFILFCIATLLTAACSSGELYGQGVPKDIPKVQVKDVLLKPSLQGQIVALEGIVVTQCASNGCWFFLNDSTGQLFIDLAPKGFAIPPRTKKIARVFGMVQQKEGSAQLVAYGVEIQ